MKRKKVRLLTQGGGYFSQGLSPSEIKVVDNIIIIESK